jgi:histidinol phosphatase-like PHP family hydrolase
MIGPPTYDAHVHTSLGLGQDSPADCVRAAAAFGLETVALTDFYDGEESQVKARLEAYAQAAAGRAVHVLPGATCHILDPQGRVTLSEIGARPFHIVIASLSPQTEGVARDVPVRLETLLDNLFRALLSACQKPHINVLGAPFALGRFPAPLSPDQLPLARLDDLAGTMRDHEVAFELSNALWDSYPELPLAELTEQYARLIMTFSRGGVKFILGTGARSAGAVGNFRYALRLAEAAGLERSQLVDLSRLH